MKKRSAMRLPIWYNDNNDKTITKGAHCTMSNYTTLGGNLKRGILNFSKKISKTLTRPAAKFVSEMIYGILSSGSCLLSEIGRNLNEEISLKKTIDRLSRNLNALDDQETKQIKENYLHRIRNRYDAKSVIIIDGSDITKKASTKLEALCQVRDGSTGEIGIGYHTIGAAILSSERKLPYGVYSRIYSSEEKDFVSENAEMLGCFKFLTAHFDKNNIRTMDRGFDNNAYYSYFIEHKEKFIIRAKQNRNVIFKGESINILKLANKFKGKYRMDYEKKNGKRGSVKISMIPVELPEFRGTVLQLVIVHGFGSAPMMLLTNLEPDDKRLCVTICKVYLMRWRIEEYFKFKKQSFDFENLRVQSLQSIRNLDLLLTLAIGYISELSNKPDTIRMRLEIIQVSKRIFGAPDFVYYAIAYGVSIILNVIRSSISSFFFSPAWDGQLPLFNGAELYYGET